MMLCDITWRSMAPCHYAGLSMDSEIVQVPYVLWRVLQTKVKEGNIAQSEVIVLRPRAIE